MQVHQAIEDLRNVHGDEILWELAETLGDADQRAVLAESGVDKRAT